AYAILPWLTELSFWREGERASRKQSRTGSGIGCGMCRLRIVELIRAEEARRSNAAFVSPSQYVKLRQHRRSKPTVCNDPARKPTPAMHEILEIGLVGDGCAGPEQRRWVSDLQIHWQRRIPRGRRPGIGIVAVVEHHDLEDTARLALCRL